MNLMDSFTTLVSQPQAEVDLLKKLNPNINIFPNEKVRDLIYKSLKEKDLKISTMSPDELFNTLEEIRKYKKMLILNSGEDILNETLNFFISDIYKDALHFFLEVLQNIDDAPFSVDIEKDGVSEKDLDIELYNDKIVFKYDENGFNFSDFFAITSFGNSTKKSKLSESGTIGEKGIGFKSVFDLMSKAEIKSRYFSFVIECDEEKLESIFEPKNITIEDKYKRGTQLTLYFKKEKAIDCINQIKEWISNNLLAKNVASAFLFLKNIKSVSYTSFDISDESPVPPVHLKRTPLNKEFCLININGQKYIKYTEIVKFSKSEIISRWKRLKEELKEKDESFSIERPLEVCFPIIHHLEDYKSIKGKVYSYLPTNIEIAFPILLNVDVHLTASRGNIKNTDFAGTEWNAKINTYLPKFLKNAYMALCKTATEDDLKDVLDLKEVREKLYLYIPSYKFKAVTNPETYKAAMLEFREEIIKEKVFLTNKNEFVNQYNIYNISTKLTVNDHESKVIGHLYNFLKNDSLFNLNYPMNEDWNKFLNTINLEEDSWNIKYIDAYQIIASQGGILKHWSSSLDSKKDDIEILLSILNTNVNYVKQKDDLYKLKLIPIENNDTFKIISFEDAATSNKPIFIHADDRSVENTTDCYFIFEESKDHYPFKYLDKTLQEILGIMKYNKDKFFESEIQKIKDINLPISKEILISFFQKSYPLFDGNFSAHNEYMAFIREQFSNYKIPIEYWNNYFNFNTEHNLCEEYIKLVDTLDLETIWIDMENDSKTIEYLIFLGVAHKITIDSVTKNLDIISLTLINNLPTGKMCIHPIKRHLLNIGQKIEFYYLNTLNKNIKNINLSHLKEHISKLLNITIDNDAWKYDGKELFLFSNKQIEDFNKELDYYKHFNLEHLNLKDLKFTIINEEIYGPLFNCIGVKNFTKNHKIFIKNEVAVSDEFIRQLRLLNCLNTALKIDFYSWHNPVTLTLTNFITCSEYLLGEEQLIKLLQKGFTFNILAEEEVKDFFTEELILFLESNGIKDIEALQKKFKIIINSEMQSPYIHLKRLKEISGKDFDYLINSSLPKDELLLLILRLNGHNKVSGQFRNEIRDFFDMITTSKIKPKFLSTTLNGPFEAGVFFNFHLRNLSELKLPSIWNKDILNILCSPLQLTDNSFTEGYGYSCPLCGTHSLIGINGLKFTRFLNASLNNDIHPYLYIVSCLNCTALLKTANKIEIENFEQVMDEFEQYYCIDDNHVKNTQSMKTVHLLLQLQDGENIRLPMKISYANLILYKKLSKN